MQFYIPLNQNAVILHGIPTSPNSMSAVAKLLITMSRHFRGPWFLLKDVIYKTIPLAKTAPNPMHNIIVAIPQNTATFPWYVLDSLVSFNFPNIKSTLDTFSIFHDMFANFTTRISISRRISYRVLISLFKTNKKLDVEYVFNYSSNKINFWNSKFVKLVHFDTSAIKI